MPEEEVVVDETIDTGTDPVPDPVEPLPEATESGIVEEPPAVTTSTGTTEFVFAPETVLFLNESLSLLAVMFGLVVGLLVASFGKEMFRGV